MKRDDILLVPNLSFLIDHRFPEIEGKDVSVAIQSIRFELSRFGAELESRAALSAPGAKKVIAKVMIFDRPFLICMKKRGATRPFFVMWVGNAELLTKT